MARNFDYDRKKKDTVVCWQEIVSYVFQRVSSLRPEKKSSSRLSGKKKKIQSSVCWVRGSGDYDRKKKKDTLVCLAGCAVVLFFVVLGNFDYDRKKKRYSRLLAGNWQFLCCGGKFSLRPEKKYIHYERKKKIQSSV